MRMCPVPRVQFVDRNRSMLHVLAFSPLPLYGLLYGHFSRCPRANSQLEPRPQHPGELTGQPLRHSTESFLISCALFIKKLKLRRTKTRSDYFMLKVRFVEIFIDLSITKIFLGCTIGLIKGTMLV
jgi:hypothetical protein